MLAGIAMSMLMTGCARSEKTEPNAANQRYLEAWMEKNHPGASVTDLGVYILEDKAGTGEALADQGYVMVSYTVSGLDGKISSRRIRRWPSRSDLTIHHITMDLLHG